MRILLLGGTGEARQLAVELADGSASTGIQWVSSLAGRVSNPALPVGDVRIGGFGGSSGLVRYLIEGGFSAVIDATHPYAVGITGNAIAACADADLPLLILRRPGWTASAEDHWHRVADITAAAATVAAMGQGSVLLTTGRRDLAAFADDERHRFVIRSVDPPVAPLPRHSTLILDRGPYTVVGERELMTEHRVEVLVTKDSGGTMTFAKLVAARQLGVVVVMVDRPALPPTVEGNGGIDQVDSVRAAVGWAERLAGRPSAAG
ncbi:cobalt-precorrin-6A reductase [Jatrophihabitans sp. DSM 45814]